MKKILLINISGSDRPGLTSSLTEILASSQTRVFDIGQAVVHETLALAMLIVVVLANGLLQNIVQPFPG